MSFTSTMAGGIISDKFRTHDARTKSYIGVFAGLVSAPFLAIAYILQYDFYLTLAMIGIFQLLSEGWSSPTFAMLLDTTDPNTQGFSVNVFFLFCCTAAMISTLCMQIADTLFEAQAYPERLGYILAAFVLPSLIGSAFAFFMAGI